MNPGNVEAQLTRMLSLMVVRIGIQTMQNSQHLAKNQTHGNKQRKCFAFQNHRQTSQFGDVRFVQKHTFKPTP